MKANEYNKVSHFNAIKFWTLQKHQQNSSSICPSKRSRTKITWLWNAKSQSLMFKFFDWREDKNLYKTTEFGYLMINVYINFWYLLYQWWWGRTYLCLWRGDVRMSGSNMLSANQSMHGLLLFQTTAQLTSCLFW